jgi:anti-sigma regulatory factor (Ser/Thr protein kinase)
MSTVEALPPLDAEETFGLSPAAPGLARGFLVGTLGRWRVPAPVTDDAELLVSELVTNAVQHAQAGPIVVRLMLKAQLLVCEVLDGDPGMGRGLAYLPSAERGRGLRLLAAVASVFEVKPTGDGKVVRFSLAIPDPARGRYGPGILGPVGAADQLGA